MEFISPTAHRLIVRNEVNRMASLDGVVFGLFHNSKPNAADFLESLIEALGEKVAIGGIVRASKAVPSSPADAAAIESMADACGAVVFATAD